MATIIRLKRRRNEDPLEVLYLANKRRKRDVAENSNDDTTNLFRFAGTVKSKVSRKLDCNVFSRKTKLHNFWNLVYWSSNINFSFSNDSYIRSKKQRIFLIIQYCQIMLNVTK